MCGIAGIVCPPSTSDPLRASLEAELRRFTDELSHRGPDASSRVVVDGIGLAHTRLAIIDLSANQESPWVMDVIGALLEKSLLRVSEAQALPCEPRFGMYESNDDHIATAIQNHAPERAIKIWKTIAQELIAQVKPSAYMESVKYLKKARKIMIAHNGQKTWDGYLHDLRVTHARKRRLMEMLDGLDGKPILKKRTNL